MAKTYIIAEAGVNHNGSLDRALELVDAAAWAGADVVKFQTFNTRAEVSRFAPKADYQLQTTDAAESQLEMLNKLELDHAAHLALIRRCAEKGLEFLSTPFDLGSLELLAHTLALPRIKLPSGEITNPLMLLAAARSGKPIILSTGMSTIGEIETALGVLAYGYTCPDAGPSLTAFEAAYRSQAGQKVLHDRVALLHCTSEYPAPFAEVNLRAMDTMRSAFGLAVGYSDHTRGIAVPIAAVARGATIIEKHFTLDRTLPGPDHKASLEPDELKQMIESIRQVEAALGSGRKIPGPGEEKNKPIVRKSIVAACDIKKGETFTAANITTKRPGHGLTPLLYWDLLGRPAKQDYGADEVILPWK